MAGSAPSGQNSFEKTRTLRARGPPEEEGGAPHPVEMRAVGPEKRLAREGRLDVFEHEHEQLAAHSGEEFAALRGDLDEVAVAGAVEVQRVPVSQVLGGDDSCREVEPTDVVAAEPHQRGELREAVGGLREDEAPLASPDR